MSKNIPIEKQLEEIEGIISAWRPDRASMTAAEARTFDALRAVASDIRGRFAVTRSEALRELQRRVDAAQASRTAIGLDRDRLVALGLEVISRWPAVRQALQRADHAEVLARTIADACEEIGCEADNEALLMAIRNLKAKRRAFVREIPF